MRYAILSFYKLHRPIKDFKKLYAREHGPDEADEEI